METRYFDELKIGDTFTSIGRTITEADLVNFISYTFLAEELFTSVEYVTRQSLFKKRIVPGMLTMSLALGLNSLIGWNRESALALLGIDEVRFLRPVVVGETVRAEATVVEKKPPTHADRGVVVLTHAVKNQDGEVVLSFRTTRLMKRRVAASG